DPAVGQPVIADLRIAGEINRRICHHRRKDNVRIGVDYAVSGTGRFVEGPEPTIDENKKLRGTHCSHRIGRKSARLRRTGYAVKRQSESLRDEGAGTYAGRGTGCAQRGAGLTRSCLSI